MRLKTLLFLIALVTYSCSWKISNTEIISQKIIEVNIESENQITISGTLNFVSNSDLAIIVAGSGTTDRNGNNNQGLSTDAYKLLSESLATFNISSFRYDKRGIGKSTNVNEENLTLYSFVTDLNNIVSHFEKQFTNIHIIGHSEGALITTLSAQKNTAINSLILLAGTGKTLDKIIIDQISQFPELIPLAEKHINEIKSNKQLSEVNPMLGSLFRQSVVPFLKSAFEIDPTTELSKVKQPVCIIGGLCDIQVPIEHGKLLNESNPNSILVEIQNMGHFLKSLNSDCSNVREAYTNFNIPINQKLVNSIKNFIKMKPHDFD